MSFTRYLPRKENNMAPVVRLGTINEELVIVTYDNPEDVEDPYAIGKITTGSNFHKFSFTFLPIS